MDPKKEMHSTERRMNKGKRRRGPTGVGKGQGSIFQEKRRGSRDKIWGKGQGTECQQVTWFPRTSWRGSHKAVQPGGASYAPFLISGILAYSKSRTEIIFFSGNHYLTGWIRRVSRGVYNNQMVAGYQSPPPKQKDHSSLAPVQQGSPSSCLGSDPATTSLHQPWMLPIYLTQGVRSQPLKRQHPRPSFLLIPA